VRDFDPFKLGLTHEEAMRMDRYVQFGVVAGNMAIKDSGLDFSKEDPKNRVCLANAICGTKYMEEEFALWLTTEKSDWPFQSAAGLYDAAMFNTPSIEISANMVLKVSVIRFLPAVLLEPIL